MIDYFDEKAEQVSVDSMTAFGIEISSRYGKAYELAEMLLFASEAAKLNVHPYVNKIFYDSKANLCTFEIDSSVTFGDPDERLLFQAAKKTIDQFDWFGCVHHKEQS